MLLFDAIEGPIFLKKGFPPIHVNSGSNFTLQAFYRTVPSSFDALRKKILVIYDVPDYFHVNTKIQSGFIKLNIVKEYVGYSIDLKGYTTLEGYLGERFNTKNRSQFRAYQRKLENAFPITYKMFFGYISKVHFEYLFDRLYELSVKSFTHKKINNRKLIPENFNFLRDATYELLLEKKACLFVVYNGEKPIGISLNFNSDHILFGDSTVYDLDYSKFNVGIIMLIKQIAWCLENNFTTYDFSKAHFPYKEKWCNVEYHFQHHILFDSKHLKSSVIAFLLTVFLNLKQYMREHRFRAFLKKCMRRQKSQEYARYSILANDHLSENKVEIPINSDKHPLMIRAVNDFIYSSSDHISDVKVFQLLDKDNTFHIQGKEEKRLVSL